MKAFLDTSSLLKIYYHETGSQAVEDVLSEGDVARFCKSCR
ncbi:MAG: type II toxin-antitoxin system VapC family toxin [Desulfobacterales bacterium]|nr:type II toxin-antitoxin system VapC family toxin [Desulfobacterales bacterium]